MKIFVLSFIVLGKLTSVLLQLEHRLSLTDPIKVMTMSTDVERRQVVIHLDDCGRTLDDD